MYRWETKKKQAFDVVSLFFHADLLFFEYICVGSHKMIQK